MFQISDQQKIGVGLAGFGIFFLFLGVLLLFDKGLLAIGNILFIVGLACVIGLRSTFFFFFQWHKARASACFCGGILIVLIGWPIVGMCFETYGFVLLFREPLKIPQFFVVLILRSTSPWQKAKASACFCGGFLIVLIGWPIVGLCFDTYGFVLLFSGFLPAAINFLRRVPVLGTVLNMPFLGGLLDRLCGDSYRTRV